MKEKLLDKDTIDAYHAYVQSQIRTDLNSISLGPGRLPVQIAKGLLMFGSACLMVGLLLITLRMQHVYFWDWQVQFVGPFFIILFLLCCGGATYLALVATRRSNRYRRELYFQPLGDYGIAAVPKDDLVTEFDMKHDLKSGTNPHKSFMPRSEAYSTTNLAKQPRSGHHNQAYRHGPADPHRRPHGYGDKSRGHGPDDRRRGPPSDPRRAPSDDPRRQGGEKRRPPDGEFRRGPPEDRRRAPSDDRRGGPPSGYRDDPRGPPRDVRSGDEKPKGPPQDHRGPPPDRRGPPPDRRGPPPDRRGPPPDRRGPPPEHRGSPPPGRRGSPPPRRGSPPPGDRRGPPRGMPPSRDEKMGRVTLEDNRDSESEL